VLILTGLAKSSAPSWHRTALVCLSNKILARHFRHERFEHTTHRLEVVREKMVLVPSGLQLAAKAAGARGEEGEKVVGKATDTAYLLPRGVPEARGCANGTLSR
jgi:hypothetical protein